MTTKTKGGDYIVWQTGQEYVLPEKPILIEAFPDIIALGQEDGEIVLNYETVEELCRLLRKISNEHLKGKK